MAYIHGYTGTITAGQTNGTLVSEDNSGSSPFAVPEINASANEVSAAVKGAVRCEAGYYTTDCVITPTGSKAAKWALSLDGQTFGDYGAALTVGSVSTTNVAFYYRAKATSDEAPANDATVDLVITATILAQ